ncbi:hypothetical protein NXS19_013640 [Fusarium pseudograminearum]|nr:hypothetical protein NXS19_013640 [Fusarium pseudograminearum]
MFIDLHPMGQSSPQFQLSPHSLTPRLEEGARGVFHVGIILESFDLSQGRATSRPHPRCLGIAVHPAGEEDWIILAFSLLQGRLTQPQFHWQQNPQTLRSLVERYGKENAFYPSLPGLRSNLSALWRWHRNFLAVKVVKVNGQTRIVAVDRVDQQASFTQVGSALAGMVRSSSVCSISCMEGQSI